mmetsp:Transcript_12711/g.18550  ORF Transcript_12711/g.18550 Transcript_12711/m.18550 type:complete len:142 (+) Transcript_12711:99-524(+)
MGNSSSTPVQAQPEAPPAITATSTEVSAEEVELMQQIQRAMPIYSRPETFEEKLYRKVSKEPLIPIGCLTTAFFLGSGIRSFYDRDAIRSQKMMRLRVGAQFGTLMIFIGYAGMNAFNLDISPGYHGNSGEEKDSKQDGRN